MLDMGGARRESDKELLAWGWWLKAWRLEDYGWRLVGCRLELAGWRMLAGGC